MATDVSATPWANSTGTNNICCNALAIEDEVVSANGQYGTTFVYATSVTYRDMIVAFRGR